METIFEHGKPLELTLEEVNMIAYIPTDDFKLFLKSIGIPEIEFVKEWSRMQKNLQFVSFMGFKTTKINVNESQKRMAILPIAAYRKLYAETQEDEEVINSLLDKLK